MMVISFILYEPLSSNTRHAQLFAECVISYLSKIVIKTSLDWPWVAFFAQDDGVSKMAPHINIGQPFYQSF